MAVELIQIGRILGPHGLGGHVQVVAVGVEPGTLEDLAVWSVGFGADAVMPRRVEECRHHVTGRGVSLVVLLDGVVDRTAAELLKGAGVYAPADDVGAVAAEDEIPDWVGYEVVDPSGLSLGVVAERLSMPAQDVLVVNRRGMGEAMVPLVPEIVRSVDPQRRVITVDPPDGLFD